MRRIYYSSGSVLTSDDVATAIMEYAEALTEEGRSDIVDLPTVLESGTAGSATLLISPASQLASVTEESNLAEPDGEALVLELRRRTDRLADPRPEAHRYAEYLSSPEEYE
ncbi:MAG: hypothetical protein JWM50_860 [Microbacteriaceae bacterium]|jgi:hypothetical protein|nr:hypothetical protein [Microbacteriaceae bacterium]